MKISVCCCGSKEPQADIGTRKNCAKRSLKKAFPAFTLAEMMVVMLILSIVLAAMAPVMTTRSRSDNSSPWRFSPNLSDAYFGAGDKQVALIGQQAVSEDGSDSDSKLLLNSSANTPKHILFKRAGTILGYLFMKDSNIALGNTEMNIANITGTDNIAIGAQTLANVTTGSNNVAVGADALSSSTTSSWNVAIGKNAFHNGTDGSNTIIGGDAMSQGTGTNNVALGTNALYYGRGNGNVALGVNANHKTETLTTFTNSTAIGYSAFASGENAVSIGYNSSATSVSSVAIGGPGGSSSLPATASNYNTIAIGAGAYAAAMYSVAVGPVAEATARESVALGYLSKADYSYSTALGSNAIVSNSYTTAVGSGTKANYPNSVAIGYKSVADKQDAIAIGSSVVADGESSVAIGSSSDVGKTTASGSRAVAIGDGSIAKGEHALALGGKAVAIGDNTIAIGDKACTGVKGANKICIGANSGPTSGAEASNDEEMVFIGSRPKWGPIRGANWANQAVLVVHNSSKTIGIGGNRGGMEAGPTVYINGNLVVRGYTFTVGRGDDDHEYEPVGVLGNKNGGLRGDQVKWYGLAEPGDYWTSSDRRLKYVGKESNSGLDKIRQLKVYNYTFKKDKHKTPHVGVIAQDLQKIFPDAVKKAKNGFLTIRMEDMFYAMINAIKELDLKYQAQEKRINELEKRIEKLEAKVK